MPMTLSPVTSSSAKPFVQQNNREVSPERLSEFLHDKYNQRLSEADVQNIVKGIEHYPKQGLRNESLGYQIGLAHGIGKKLGIHWGDVNSVFKLLIKREREDFVPSGSPSPTLSCSSSESLELPIAEMLAQKRKTTELLQIPFSNKRRIVPAEEDSGTIVVIETSPQQSLPTTERGRLREIPATSSLSSRKKRDALSPDSKALSTDLNLSEAFDNARLKEKRTGKNTVKNLALYYQGKINTQSSVKLKALTDYSKVAVDKISRYGFRVLKNGVPKSTKRKDKELENLADFLTPGPRERSRDYSMQENS
jgi:hypothetical protein